MNKILLDTDVIINILKKDQKYIDKIEVFFNKIENIDICKYTGVQAGKYANQYKKAYNNISLEDYLIAANGKINSCMIWTNNKKHYPMDDIRFV